LPEGARTPWGHGRHARKVGYFPGHAALSGPSSASCLPEESSTLSLFYIESFNRQQQAPRAQSQCASPPRVRIIGVTICLLYQTGGRELLCALRS